MGPNSSLSIWAKAERPVVGYAMDYPAGLLADTIHLTPPCLIEVVITQ
jgi:hypothetical protein